MKVTKLSQHSILKKASVVVRSYIKKCDPVDKEKDPIATPKESYGIKIFIHLSNILNCLDQIHFSIGLLSGFRKEITPDNMNRHDYIVFGVENYFLRFTSIYDRCLRFTNEVFQLGIPGKECKENTIIRNSHINKTEVSKTLKKINKFTDKFRHERNKVAHATSYSEESLNCLGSYYYLEQVGEDNMFKYRHLYKKETDSYIMDKKVEFQKNLIELESHVKDFFDSIEPYFEVKLKSIV